MKQEDMGLATAFRARGLSREYSSMLYGAIQS